MIETVAEVSLVLAAAVCAAAVVVGWLDERRGRRYLEELRAVQADRDNPAKRHG